MKEELYIQLIYKDLQGTIPPKEKLRLNRWVEEKSENQLIYKAIQKVWETSKDYTPYTTLHLDLDEEYLALKQKIGTSKKQTKILPLRKAIWVAASFLLAIFTANFLYNNYAETKIEVITASQSSLTHTLTDGSEVWLQQGSSLSIPSKFTLENRQITLSGEGFFSVKSDPANPFKVLTKKGEVEVLGTKFHLKEEVNSILLQVQEGKVRLSKKGIESEVFIGGEAGVLNINSKNIKRLDRVNPNKFAWQSKHLIFKDENLEIALNEISALYGIELNLENKELLKCPISIELNNEQIESSLESISLIYGANWRKTSEAAYTLSGGFCR